MKKLLSQMFCLITIFAASLLGQEHENFNFYEEIIVNVNNTIQIERIDELVSISVDELIKNKTNFNKDAFIVYLDEKEIPSQLYKNGTSCSIIFTADFKPNESKKFSIKYLKDSELRKNYASRTYAELAMKFDAVFKDKKFTSNSFQNFNKVAVPEIHTDHDALFKYEGPGWESEKVGYRFYLDWRNGTDIFGKKVNELVLNNVGAHDVTANDDSYHEMQDWGMDVFKVGNSLGIGSIGMMTKDNKIEGVAKTDARFCEISSNGPIVSEIKTTYSGWLIDENKYDLESNFSIAAGSRITNANLIISGDAGNITTGLAKHENTEFIKSQNEGDWQYIAVYGKQSLADDNLGIVLFYKKSGLIKQGEDELNYFVELKPSNGNVQYAFAAAWEKEYMGIKNLEEFNKYISNEAMKLNNPIVSYIK